MKISVASAFVLLALSGLGAGRAWAQMQPAIPPPDDRYKADLLVVVAHPDDDTAVSTLMAKAVFDEGKRVAVIFTTRGNAGPNAVGMEQSKALADERELEARRSLAARGVTNVWFLHGQDTPTQDVLHSLETLGHGAALEEMVRLIRLTRPEVVVTWLPGYVAGENHGDHQASSVVATEAFDLAASPTAFPEQLTPPRYNRGIANYGEGLHPWQAKKIYFFSDASHPEFLTGHGPTYLASEMSAAKHETYAEINRQAWKDYATQVDFDEATLQHYAEMPETLVLGKSLVKTAQDADVFAGVDGSSLPWRPMHEGPEQSSSGITLTLGGPWSFYQEFYRAHGLESLEGLVPPQTALSADRQLWVPLLLTNRTGQGADVTLHANLPAGWTGTTRNGDVYHVEPGATYPIMIFMTAPDDSGKQAPQTLTWTAKTDGTTVGPVSLKVYLEYNGVPQ